MKAQTRLLISLLLMVFATPLLAAEYDARLHWERKVSLSTPVSGVVVAVNAAVGDRVKQGTVLVQLDDRARRARVTALQAELKRAQNNRDEAERELERTQELFDRTVLAEHDLQMAVIQRDAAVADLHSTEAALTQAELELEYSAVRAPFDGHVVRRQVESGQTVVSELQSVPLLEVADTSVMLARAMLGADQLRGVKQGSAAKVVVAGNTFQGKVVHIDLEPREGAKDQYAVDVRFATNGQLLRVGQAARVTF